MHAPRLWTVSGYASLNWSLSLSLCLCLSLSTSWTARQKIHQQPYERRRQPTTRHPGTHGQPSRAVLHSAVLQTTTLTRRYVIPRRSFPYPVLFCADLVMLPNVSTVLTGKHTAFTVSSQPQPGCVGPTATTPLLMTMSTTPTNMLLPLVCRRLHRAGPNCRSLRG